MSFLTSHLALFVGAIAFFLAVAFTRLAKDLLLRADAKGAARLLGLFVVLRLNGIWLDELISPEWRAYLRVGWMLALAFGLVRLTVACVLWVRRRFTTGASAKIHRDVADFVLYVLVTIPILKTQLKLDVTTLLGTSAVLSLVLGFALQDTLGNLFSGLSLQLESPYDVGDYIRVGEKTGRVVQIAWRSTRIETLLREAITIPNSLIAREKVTNFTRGGLPVAIDLEFGASYGAAPNFVKAEALETLREAPLVLMDPPPWVGVRDFGSSAVTYLVRFFIADYAQVPLVTDEILSRLWYRFGRDGIEIPFPQRVVHFRSQENTPARPDVELLRKLPLFNPFPDEEAAALSKSAVERRFGAGEEIITEGRAGTTFYVLVSGRLSVRVGQPPKEVATMERGAAFGEMSLLTGEPRAATVVALEDSVLLEFSREAFARHLESHPERLAQLAALLDERKANLAAAAANHTAAAPAQGTALTRLREIFGKR